MKIIKLFSYTALFVLLGFSSYSQCVPNSSYTKSGIYPNAATNLDTAFPGVYYQMVMTAVVPKDTLVFGNPLPIDSIGISKFEGLPNGFTAKANTSSSYWHGGKSGCVLVSGTASEADAGVYPLTIQVIAVVAGIPAPYSVPGYKLIVSGSSSIRNDQTTSQTIIQYPNPFSSQTAFHFSVNKNESVLFEVYSIDGRRQKMDLISAIPGNNNYTFLRDNLKEGLYFYRFIFDHSVFSGSFLIKN